MWVRGLKLLHVFLFVLLPVSHPMWVRGLKQREFNTREGSGTVAPYVGAWIETIS